jgi:WS/DGAT/MGAT family acyltransferase
MAKAVGASFNDIVLWICATALRDYLGKQGQLPKKSLLAAMPISLREEGNQDLNTQASMTVVDLGTQYAHPVKRLHAILRSTAKVKVAMTDLKGLIPTNYPSLLAPWVVGGVAKAAFKTYQTTGLSHRLPMLSNLVISNVPGPQVPLYLAGAKLLTYHPMSIVIHGTALNITIQTYAGWVDFGVIADKSAVPQVQDLTQALVQAFEEGRRQLLSTPAPTDTAPRNATRRKSSPVLKKPLNKSSVGSKTKKPAREVRDSATPTPSLSATVKKLANTIKKASLT